MYDFPTFVSMNCECPNCKQSVSDNALFCPNCGCVFKGNIFSLIEELKKHNTKTEINNLTDENEEVKIKTNPNIITDNMVIGIRIPIKLDVDKAVDIANKIMKKVIMVLEPKEKNSKNEENKESEEEIKQDDKNVDSHNHENQSKDMPNLNDFMGEEQFLSKSVEDIEKDTKKEIKKDTKLKSNVNKNNLRTNYVIDYRDENEFHKKERNIKKYNMLAYKKLLFDYYPSLREGKFQGVLISKNGEVEKYELTLPTDKTFRKVHGNITLHYTVYLEQKTVILETLTPEDILTKGHQKELTTYKGVMVSKSHKDLDMFKINLLNSMNKNE